MYDKIYYPYPSTDKRHKYLIITNLGKKIKFGQYGAEDYTIHKDEERKNAYIRRHQKLEKWGKDGIDTKGWWSKEFLWSYPTKEEAYKKIKDKLLKWGYITKEQYLTMIYP
jgi:hypothetical protein